MKFKWLSLLVLAALLFSPAAALAHDNPSMLPLTSALLAGVPGTVRIAVPEPGSIDPALLSTELEATIVNQLFSGLTRIDPVTKAPIPDLASSWSVSADGKEYIFTLRPGLTWSDGSSLTAHDVRYGVIRSLNPATGSALPYVLYPILNAYEYNTGAVSDPNEVGVTVLSNTQVKFTLVDPASYFPANLAQPPARPVPALTINTWGSSWTEPGHIVTSGPYRLTQWVHNDRMLLDKSASFYDAVSVQIPHISVRLTDESTAWSLFLSGSLDTTSVPVNELWWVRTNPSLGPLLHNAPGGCTRYLGFNPALEPFDDPLVRKAFIAALDRQGLIDAALNGNPLLAQTFTPPGVFGAVDGVTEGVGIPYNPAQAQQWLSDAGYPNGAGLPPITFWSFIRPGHPDFAEYLQGNWVANLNVTVNVEKLPWGDYYPHVDDGNWQIWRLNWCLDYNDAYNFLYDAIVPSPGRYGGWSNPGFLTPLEQAASSDDNIARKEYYRQAEEVLVETDPVVIPLYFSQSQVLTQPYLHRPYTLPFDVHVRDWSLTITSKAIASTAAYDGWVLESTETSGIGGTMNAGAATFNLGDTARDQQYRAILSFNTGALPDSAIITKVQLRIRKQGLVGTNPFTTHGGLKVDIKKGAFSNAAALQLGDFKALASKNAVGTFGKTPSSGWYTATLSSAALPFINKAGTTQVRLLFTKDDNDDLGADYMLFYSGNSAAANRPVLMVTYYLP